MWSAAEVTANAFARASRPGSRKQKGDAEMRLTDLPLDTWVVIEPVAADEVKLLSTHGTQNEAEIERDKRNKGLGRPRYRAIKALAPVAGAQGCAAGLLDVKCAATLRQ
jgi:hypothetical protein